MELLTPKNSKESSDLYAIHILVFRTNLNNSNDQRVVAPLLNSMTSIVSWSVDTEDIDKVLRVEALNPCSEKIIDSLNRAGYQCQELED